MQTAFHSDFPTKKAEIMREITVAISANLPHISEKIRALAQNSGARIAPEGSRYEILLIAADTSAIPQIVESASHGGKVCAIWTGNLPSRATISRFLRAGVGGIISIDANSEQFRLALKAVYQGLQVLDPTFTRELGGAPEAVHSGIRQEELTHREQQVLSMMAEGLSNKEISSRLTISTHTVKFHISSILGKLGATSRTEAVSIGIRSGRVAI
jgi:DNA-binding NarL/FixJ family response regulator